MRPALGVALGAIIALAVACGAAMPQHNARPAPRGVEMPRPADAHAQIQQLADDIASREQAAGLPPNPQPYSGGDLPRTCTPSTSDTCSDTCKLGDSICDDAERICNLADQLPGDAWATDRCAAGKASCARAHQRCCDCH